MGENTSTQQHNTPWYFRGSFVALLAWRGLSYLFLSLLSGGAGGGNRGWVLPSLLSHSWLVTPALPLRSGDSMPASLMHPVVMHILALPLCLSPPPLLLPSSLSESTHSRNHIFLQSWNGNLRESHKQDLTFITMRAWLKGQNESVSPSIHCP